MNPKKAKKPSVKVARKTASSEARERPHAPDRPALRGEEGATLKPAGRRRRQLPDGVALAPRHQRFTGADLFSRFVSSATGEAFSVLAEDSPTVCTWRCPAGHSYSETRAAHRHSRGCPTCATSVATRMPGLLRYWDEQRNALPATDVSAYSREKSSWRCEHGHHFERPPYRVLATGHQCQECRRQGHVPWRIAGKTGDKLTFAEAHPEIAAEWDYDKNARGPEEFAPGSQRLAYWRCPNGHSWSSPICHRTSTARHPASCQQCKAIAYSAPALARQLHPTLNPPDTASTVRKGSSEVLFWQCEHGHVFSASVAARLRTTYPASCDKCRSIAIKAPDLIRACWAYDRNGDLDPELLKTSSPDEAWWVKLSSLRVPLKKRGAQDYECKRVGYRFRRYLNNPQREVTFIREFLAEQDQQARTKRKARKSSAQAAPKHAA